ncbi:hypothetical protein D3C80_1699040 [compost metagenome]
MFSKMPLTTHMIHSAMLLMRITRPTVRAMAPLLIRPRLHSHRASAAVTPISRPLRQVTLKSRAVTVRVCRRALSSSSCIASRA